MKPYLKELPLFFAVVENLWSDKAMWRKIGWRWGRDVQHPIATVASMRKAATRVDYQDTTYLTALLSWRQNPLHKPVTLALAIDRSISYYRSHMANAYSDCGNIKARYESSFMWGFWCQICIRSGDMPPSSVTSTSYLLALLTYVDQKEAAKNICRLGALVHFWATLHNPITSETDQYYPISSWITNWETAPDFSFLKLGKSFNPKRSEPVHFAQH